MYILVVLVSEFKLPYKFHLMVIHLLVCAASALSTEGGRLYPLLGVKV